MCPNTQTRINKTRIQRKSLAVTSGKYQEIFQKKHLAKAAEKEEKERRKRSMRKQSRRIRRKFQNMQLNGNFSKKQMMTLNAIQCATFLRQGPKVGEGLVVKIVTIYITSYA